MIPEWMYGCSYTGIRGHKRKPDTWMAFPPISTAIFESQRWSRTEDALVVQLADGNITIHDVHDSIRDRTRRKEIKQRSRARWFPHLGADADINYKREGTEEVEQEEEQSEAKFVSFYDS